MNGRDLRMSGFAELLPLSEARALIEAMLPALGTEIISAGSAAGRVLAEPVIARVALPGSDRAATDGYAVRAADTEGAGDYTPVSLALAPRSDALPIGGAAIVGCGQPLPAGADTVLHARAVGQGDAAVIDVAAPLARGAGVQRSGSELAAGDVAVAAGRRLRPQDVGLLAVLGTCQVGVRCRPRVAVVVIGPRAPDGDAVTPMLAALLARDGANSGFRPCAGQDMPSIREAVMRGVAACDLLLVAGRSGGGADDDAAAAIADAGAIPAFHGVALRPGESAGCWRLQEVPLLLLPGAPLACLTAYDSLASPIIRRLSGLPEAAYRATTAVLERKIVSIIGSHEHVRVAMAGGRATPLGDAEAGGLGSAVRADGFVCVPASSEGYPPGASVCVHLYDGTSRP